MSSGSSGGTLFVDRYRPRSLDDLNYHPELSSRLRSLASSDFPHTLFYGPSGAGKKTRIMCTLRELYGPGVEKIRIEQRVVTTKTNRKIAVNVVQSNYHIELTPSDAGNQDIHVVQDILKEIAQSQQIDLNAKKRFKVVIINEADLLTRDAQSALRRTMEKFTSNLRVILCANSTSRIIAPIRSRCLLLRVGVPTEEEASPKWNFIAHVSKKESLNLPAHISTLLARISQGNLRRALLSLEALHVQDPTFRTIPTTHSLLVGEKQRSEDADIVPRPDWEKYAGKTAEKILSDQTPERLLEVRGMLYELLVHCVPPPVIVATITTRLVERVDEDLKADIVYWAAFYEHRIRQGSKPIFHLEAFCAKIMSVYKHFLMGIALD
ncbi:replication factor C subunit 5 [Pseudohyphozyma bogoriensis]|nr:replication factor C subunit 5 [Pseudohyphozyma bogoriensis]